MSQLLQQEQNCWLCIFIGSIRMSGFAPTLSPVRSVSMINTPELSAATEEVNEIINYCSYI